MHRSHLFSRRGSGSSSSDAPITQPESLLPPLPRKDPDARECHSRATAIGSRFLNCCPGQISLGSPEQTALCYQLLYIKCVWLISLYAHHRRDLAYHPLCKAP